MTERTFELTAKVQRGWNWRKNECCVSACVCEWGVREREKEREMWHKNVTWVQADFLQHLRLICFAFAMRRKSTVIKEGIACICASKNEPRFNECECERETCVCERERRGCVSERDVGVRARETCATVCVRTCVCRHVVADVRAHRRVCSGVCA